MTVEHVATPPAYVRVGEATNPGTPFYYRPGERLRMASWADATRYARIVRARGYRATVEAEEPA